MTEDPKPIEVYVFPLKDIVLYPRATVPLNVFEPRYIKMIDDAMANETPVVLCQSQLAHQGLDADQKFSGIVCGMGAPQLLHKNEDGSMVVLLRGHGKVELGRILSDAPYIVCEARVLVEQLVVDPKNLFRLNRMRSLLETWIKSHLEDVEEQVQFMRSMESHEMLIESAAMVFLDDPRDRQDVLEFEDINQKLDYLFPRLPAKTKFGEGSGN